MKKRNKFTVSPDGSSLTTRGRAPDVRAAEMLRIPLRTQEAFRSLEAVKKEFALPVTMGAPREERLAMDAAFNSMGGFDTIFSSLQQHAFDMGQYPVTSFVGYGALQQIAQNGMIRACVQTVADDVTREWITVTGGDNCGARAEELQNAQEAEYHLKELFHEAATLTGYMGGAFIFIDTGTDKLDLPLAINKDSAELTPETNLRFVVVDPVNVSPGEYNSTDPLKGDFMKPKKWWVLGKLVHASRLIPLLDNPPPTLLRPAYNFLGIPQAQILWDYVLHWNQCRVYTADLLKKISLLVYKTEFDAFMGAPDGIRQLDAKMAALQRYRDNNSVFACDKDSEDVLNVQTSMAGCTDVVRQSLEMIAAINRTPAVKLLGISPSGFNATGESDIRNYYDHIRSKQELRRDAILKCLKCIQLVKYGDIDNGISFDFNELGEEQESSRAMTAQARAGMLGTLAQIQAISAEEVRRAAKQDPSMGLEFLDDEMPDADEEEMIGHDYGDGSALARLMEAAQQKAEANPPDESRQLETERETEAQNDPGH